MELSDTIQIGMLGLVILQLGFAIYSFSRDRTLQLETLKADHERRKKEATIAYVNTIRGQYREIRKQLDAKFGEGNTINLPDIDDETAEKLKEILSLMEHLAAGVNTDVFDFDMIYIMSGSYFSGIFDRCIPYIKDRRIKKGNEATYIEFEHMVQRIKDGKRTRRSRAADLKDLPTA